ncbi:ABC transporter ATP-binding protein [Flexivirga caeni]|uniref:ABC transporter ATP-binding protein n=2 Tax=Flexivirga caeni TaxID=2294115 RepID=A0A3M9MIA8_9MICO|nr:ABC transporter ATP-binding protein [Flexivirga caeni]
MSTAVYDGAAREKSGRALLPVATGADTRRQVRILMRGRSRALLAAVLVLLADSVLGLASPIAIGWITQAIADHRQVAALIAPVVLLAGAAVAGAVSSWGSTVLLARVVLPAVGRLREQALSAAVELPIDEVEAGGTGDLVSRVSGDVDRISDAAEGSLGSFLGAGLAILATLAGLASLDWRFALAGLLAVPIQAITLRWYLRASRPIYAGGRIADGRRASALLAGFAALPTLRALRMGDRQRDRIEASSEAAMDYEFRATRVATRFFGRLNSAEFVGLGAILVVAFVLVRDGRASIGAATTAALFFAGLFDPINTVLGVFDSIQQAGAGLERLVGLTLAGPDRAGQPIAAVPAALVKPPALEADGLSFGYLDGPDVLHEVSVYVAPGEHVAVVGTTGSGKSTLATLLAGLRSPRSGRITLSWNGSGAAQGSSWLRHEVALVTQETHVFAGTITDNLRLVRPDAADGDLARALETVGANWVAALPDGVRTVVGSGGTPLSASQAQHLALARLVLLDPPVVVLDEATAEAGSDAARSLDGAAAAVLRGRSAVVIAHRLSQAADADQIIVMDGGRILERGTHEQLLAVDGAYARLFEAWSKDWAGTRPAVDS